MNKSRLMLIAATIAVAVVTGSAHAASVTSAAHCKRGTQLAYIGGNLVCLTVGQPCKASLQKKYLSYDFTCKAGRLTRYVIPTPTPPPGASRTNPIPLGKPGDLGNGWTVTVTQVTPDATAAVLAANSYNAQPAVGNQFFMVAVTATYRGSSSSRLDSGYTFRAVGAGNVGYTTFTNKCGVLPKPNIGIDDPDTFSGGTITGNAACWQIASADAGSLVMYAKGFLSDTTVWFALR